MRESVIYEWIIEQGIEQGRTQGEVSAMRRVISHLGTQCFGSPPPDVMTRLASVDDLASLERASDGILTAGSWDELLSLAGA